MPQINDIEDASIQKALNQDYVQKGEADSAYLDETRQGINDANSENEEMSLIAKVTIEAINEEASSLSKNIYSEHEIHLKPCLIDCLSLDPDLARKIDSDYSLCHYGLPLKSKIDFVTRFKENISTKVNARIKDVTDAYGALLQKERLELRDIKKFTESLQLSCGIKINPTDLSSDFYSNQDSLTGKLSPEILKTKKQFSEFLEEKLISIFQSSKTSQDNPSQDFPLNYYDHIKDLDLFDEDGLIDFKKIHNLLELFNLVNCETKDDIIIQQNKMIAGLLILKDMITISEDYQKFYYFDLFNKIDSNVLIYKKLFKKKGNLELNKHIDKLINSIEKNYEKDLEDYQNKLSQEFASVDPEDRYREMNYCDNLVKLGIEGNSSQLKSQLRTIDNIYYEKLLNLFLYFGQKRAIKIMIDENKLSSHLQFRRLLFKKFTYAIYNHNVSEARNIFELMTKKDKNFSISFLQQKPYYLRDIELTPSIIKLLIENEFDKKILIERVFLSDHPNKKIIEAIVNSIEDETKKYTFIDDNYQLLDYLIRSDYPIDPLIKNCKNLKALGQVITSLDDGEKKNILIRKVNEHFYSALANDQIEEALNLIKNFNFIKTIDETFTKNIIASLNKIAIKAVERDDLDVIKKLQELHFDLKNIIDYRGLSLINIATIKNNLGMLKILIEDAKISPYSTNTKGETILHRACYLGHNEIVKYLLEKKCNIYAKTSDGKTPYDYAIEGGRSEIVKLLKNYISSESEKNPLDPALRTNSAPRNRTIYNRPDTPASHSSRKVREKKDSLETEMFKEIDRCICSDQLSLEGKVVRLIYYINSSNQEYKILPIQMLIQQNKIEIFKELIRHPAFLVDAEFIDKIKSIAKINGKKNFEGELLSFKRELDSKKSKPNTTTITRTPKSNEKGAMSRKLQDIVHQTRGEGINVY